MRRIHPSRLFLAACVLLATASKAEAEFITLRLDGVISEIVSDPAGLLPANGVAVGTPFVGFLSLNTAAIPSTPTEYVSRPEQSHPAQILGSLSLVSGGLQITSEGAQGLIFVVKRDNVLLMQFEDVQSNFGFFDVLAIHLDASGELPDFPLATLASTTFTGGSFGAGLSAFSSIDLRGSISSVTNVPEPSTLLSMLVAAGTFLAGRRRLLR